jgi:hypothetical protein
VRLYVQVTGLLFALLVAAHIARMATENMVLAKDPLYVGITVFAAAMAVWAFATLRKRS